MEQFYFKSMEVLNMGEHTKKRHIWHTFWPFGAYFIFPSVVTLVAFLIFQSTSDLYNFSEFFSKNTRIILFFSSILGLMLWIPLWRKTKKANEDLNDGKLTLVKIVLAGGSFIGTALLAVTFLSITAPPSRADEVVASMISGGLLMRILTTGLLVPLAEELLFRGII